MIWDVKISNLYAQLDKLAQHGLIQGSVLESEQQRPARTAFALTGEGRTLIVLDWGNQLLAQAVPCDILFVDEMGPLEFL